MPDLTTIVIALIVMAVIGDWLTKRAQRRREVVAAVAADSSGEVPANAVSFLTRLDTGLRLPEDVRREIELELRDHLIDTIAELEAEGLDRERATGEALARLGRPEELARQLSIAHQSNVRLLVGAAGGVFSAAGGVVYGLFVGYFLAFMALIAGAILLAVTVGRFVPPIRSEDLAFNTVFGCIVAYVPAVLAARRAVAASAAISQREPSQLARWWAIAGAIAILGVVLFVVSAEQSWIAVGFELGAAVVFAVAALYRPSVHVPTLHIGRAIALVLAGTVLSVVLVYAASPGGGSGGTVYAKPYDPSSLGLHRIAPNIIDPHVAIDGPSVGVGQPHMTLEFGADVSAYVGWHDLQLEAWRAAADPSGDLGDTRVDLRFSGPYATYPIAKLTPTLRVDVDLSHSRTTLWMFVATGVSPDGKRYLLTPFPHAVESRYTGSVWDWLTAGD